MSASDPGLSAAVRLAQHLAAQPRARFDWRANNCCHFAARWVLCATGRDPMAGLPETPDARAALHLVRDLGGHLRDAWTRQLGCEPVPPARAGVGDVVLFAARPHDGDALWGTGALVGVCCGAQVACLNEAGDVLFLPLAQAHCAWHIGGPA